MCDRVTVCGTGCVTWCVCVIMCVCDRLCDYLCTCDCVCGTVCVSMSVCESASTTVCATACVTLLCVQCQFLSQTASGKRERSRVLDAIEPKASSRQRLTLFMKMSRHLENVMLHRFQLSQHSLSSDTSLSLTLIVLFFILTPIHTPCLLYLLLR